MNVNPSIPLSVHCTDLLSFHTLPGSVQCTGTVFSTIKADSNITCRVHAVPLPCRAAKGLECVFPIWFTQCGRVWFTLAIPRPCHPRPCHSSQGHGTAWPSRKSMWTKCPRSASSGYHAEFHEVVIRRITISYAGGQCETKHRLSWTRKRVVAAHYKKDDLLHCGLAVRIFPATMRTFTKDTALSEQGRGAAWHVWINARHGRGTAWKRHGRGMLYVNPPLSVCPHVADGGTVSSMESSCQYI